MRYPRFLSIVLGLVSLQAPLAPTAYPFFDLPNVATITVDQIKTLSEAIVSEQVTDFREALRFYCDELGDPSMGAEARPEIRAAYLAGARKIYLNPHYSTAAIGEFFGTTCFTSLAHRLYQRTAPVEVFESLPGLADMLVADSWIDEHDRAHALLHWHGAADGLRAHAFEANGGREVYMMFIEELTKAAERSIQLEKPGSDVPKTCRLHDLQRLEIPTTFQVRTTVLDYFLHRYTDSFYFNETDWRGIDKNVSERARQELEVGLLALLSVEGDPRFTAVVADILAKGPGYHRDQIRDGEDYYLYGEVTNGNKDDGWLEERLDNLGKLSDNTRVQRLRINQSAMWKRVAAGRKSLTQYVVATFADPQCETWAKESIRRADWPSADEY